MAAAAVSVSKAVSSPSLKTCAVCQKTAEKLQRCTRCREVFYCNQDCQIKAWPQHKLVCVVKPQPNPQVVAAAPASQGAAAAAGAGAGKHGLEGVDIQALLARYREITLLTSAPSAVKVEYSPVEQDYIKRLNAFPCGEIIARGAVEKACKALGQEIFDTFKKQAGGDSLAGKEAVQKICNALDPLRRQCVERAWDGVGDKIWFWMQ